MKKIQARCVDCGKPLAHLSLIFCDICAKLSDMFHYERK